MSYKVKVEDRKYTQYEYLDVKTLKKSEKEFTKSPAEMRLFNQDIIDENYNVLHSSVRSMRFIPGVLICDGTDLWEVRWYYNKSILLV